MVEKNQGYMIFPSSFNIEPTKQQRTTDMSGLIQDAIDFCLENNIGTLKFQPGKYPLASPLRIHASGLTIMSTANAKAVINDPKRVPVFELTKNMDQGILIAPNGRTSGGALIGRIRIENISLRSIGKATKMGLMTFYNAFSCEVSHCYIGGARTPGGIDSKNKHIKTDNAHQGHQIMMLRDRSPGTKAISWLNRISYCNLHWATRKGLVMESSDSWIEKNYISHTAGVAENAHSGNEYEGNHIDLSRGLGDQAGLSFVERNPVAKGAKAATMIVGNYFDIHKIGIQFSKTSKGTVITGNHFRDCTQTYIHLVDAKHISVTANSFRKSSKRRFSPILSNDAKKITIASNVNFNRFQAKLKPFLHGNTFNITRQ